MTRDEINSIADKIAAEADDILCVGKTAIRSIVVRHLNQLTIRYSIRYSLSANGLSIIDSTRPRYALFLNSDDGRAAAILRCDQLNRGADDNLAWSNGIEVPS